MTQSIREFMTADHARLDELLLRSLADASELNRAAFAEFRAGLLRHIAMEEKVLLPDLKVRSGKPFALARQLRADHAALAVLMVPPPTHELVALIRGVLEEHNPLEEGPEGLYEQCERAAAGDCQIVLERLRRMPEVPLAPHLDRPSVHEHIAELLRARKQVQQ